MYDIPTKRAKEFELPVLGLGTWQMGGRFTRDSSNNDERNIKAIEEAIRLGIRHIDTAEVYAAGHAETLVRKAIERAGIDREELFITTKVFWKHLRYDEVIRAAEKSLERLGLKQVDLYLIHASNPTVPLKETMRAMDYLLEHGLTRFIGVSNFDVPLLKETQRYTKHKIVNNQIHYNLLARAYEANGTLEYCKEHDILVTAYRPLEKGKPELLENTVLSRIAKKYKKTPAQVALNWVMGKPNIVTLVKTSDPEHLKEDLGALGWQLKSDDEKELDQNFPSGETINVPHR